MPDIPGEYPTRKEGEDVIWYNSVGRALAELSEEVEGLRTRLEGEEFLSLFIEATQTAQRTHEESTREQLRNAVLNAALQKETVDWQHVFLRLIAQLRPAHVQFLKYLDGPEVFLDEEQRRRVDSMTMTNIFYFVNEVCFYDQLRRDLVGAGLADVPDVTMTGRGTMSPRTTPLGKRFLAFITNPADEGPVSLIDGTQ